MKTISIILIALTAVTATPAVAAEWWLVGDRNPFGGEAPHRTILFVDRESISRDGSKVLVWTAIEHESVRSDGEMSRKHYRRYDCALRKYTTLKMLVFDEKEMMIRWSFIPLSDQIENVMPPILDSLRKFLCESMAGNPHKVPDDIGTGAYADTVFSAE